MITRVNIKNFRSFQDFEIGDFTRVNLLVGENSLGKSTILEAIACLASGCNLKNYQIITQNRGLHQPSPQNDIPYRSFFYNFDFQNDICIQGESNQGPLRVIIQGNKLTQSPQADPSQNPPSSSSPQLETLTIHYLHPLSDGWQSQTADTRENLAPIGHCQHAHHAQWIQPGPLNLQRMALILGQAQMDTKKKHQFLQLIQAVDPDVIDYSYIPTTPENGYISLKMKDDRGLPLQLIGSGYLWMIYILYECVYSGAAVICVDEIDTGLHRSVMIDFWKALHRYFQQNPKLQLFATTHSEEFIEATLTAFEDRPDDLTCFRFVRNPRKNNQVDTIQYQYKNISTLQAHESSLT